MIMPGAHVQVLVATKPVDFRKGPDGLAAYVQEQMKIDPFCGTIYVFRAPCRRQARKSALPARRAPTVSSCCGGTAPACAC